MPSKSTYKLTPSPNRLRHMDILYFLITLLFFYVQLHVVIDYAWHQTIPLTALLLNLLFFKLGELLHELFDGGPSLLWIGTAAVTTFLIPEHPAFYPLYLLFGLSMMKIRVELAAYSARSVKLTSRALGFILAPLYHPVAYLLFAVVAFGYALYHFRDIRTGDNPRLHGFTLSANRPVYLTMGVHHAHYFIYCYTIPITFAALTDLPVWTMGLVFFVGWAAYNAYEKWLKPTWPAFIIGHAIGAAALYGLWVSDSLSPLLFWWFMTGLGGGTVYMLHSLVPQPADVVDREMSITEGFGHVVGVGAWALIALYSDINLSYLAGAALAVVSLLTASYAFRTTSQQKRSTGLSG